MRRFIVASKSEPGYRSKKEAESWIAGSRSPDDYYIMEVISEIPPEALKQEANTQKWYTKMACKRAVQDDRLRIAKILGLGDI